jgi:hypothetical protein
MASYTINDVDEIVVNLTDGTERIYRAKGLEKFRKIMVASPAYGAPKVRSRTTKVEEEDDFDEEEGATPVPGPAAPAQKVASKPVPAPSAGYNSMGLNYAPAKGSAIDIARQMQQQASKTPGVKLEFG